MAPQVLIKLDDRAAGLIDRVIAEGRYVSVGEVIRAGLRLLDEHEGRMRALRAALVSGEASGTGEVFDFEHFMAQRRTAAG